MNKKIFFFTLPAACLLLSLLACKKKQPLSNAAQRQSKKAKRIIYIWDINKNTGCFLQNGIKKCYHASFKRLTKNICSLRLSEDPLRDNDVLKLTFKEPTPGLKKIPDADASYTDNKNNLYTFYDVSKHHVFEILSFKNNVIEGRFNFKLKSLKGKGIYFTQGYFKAEMQF